MTTARQNNRAPKTGDARKIILLVGVLGMCFLLVYSVRPLRNDVLSGVFRLSSLGAYGRALANGWRALTNEVPTSPLEGVIDWDRDALKPSTCQPFDGEWVKIPATTVCINSDGLRDYEYSVGKPPGAFRVLFVGDSVTFGWGVELEETVPKHLEALLLNQTTTKVEVLNFGVPGANLISEIALVEEKGLKYKPDLVLFLFNENDFEDPRSSQVLTEAVNSYLLEHPGSNHKEAIMAAETLVVPEMTERFREENVSSLHTRIFPTLEKLSRLAASGDFSVGVIITSCFDNQRIFLKNASETLDFSMMYVDMESHPEYNPLKMKVHLLDGHPSALANRITAELIAAQMDSYLPTTNS